MDFIPNLQRGFNQNKSAENAVAMAAYMKGNFPFLGIKTQVRRALLKDAWTDNNAEVKAHSRDIALKLYALPEREYHYCAIDILVKELKKKFVLADIDFIEYLLVTHSWWDSVDTIAKYLLGGYLSQFPEQRDMVIEKFSDSKNMWLNRSAIIFQLGYKTDTDAAVLFAQCLKQRESKEFFIQKAIGWALREYGKHYPDAVKQFVAQHTLKPLSTREALKNL